MDEIKENNIEVVYEVDIIMIFKSRIKVDSIHKAGIFLFFCRFQVNKNGFGIDHTLIYLLFIPQQYEDIFLIFDIF